jgi:hypothetical protein
MGDVEAFVPEFLQLDSRPELLTQYKHAYAKRGLSHIVSKAKKEGQIKSKIGKKEMIALKFQGWYSKGELPDGTPWPDHRRKMKVRPFKTGCRESL